MILKEEEGGGGSTFSCGSVNGYRCFDILDSFSQQLPPAGQPPFSEQIYSKLLANYFPIFLTIRWIPIFMTTMFLIMWIETL